MARDGIRVSAAGALVHAKCRRIGCAVLLVCMLTALEGCVVHQDYAAGVPQTQLARVEGYWRYFLAYYEELQIAAVDGKAEGPAWLYAYSISLPAGKHALTIVILRNGGDIVRCNLERTFEAGLHYKLQRLKHDQPLLAHPAQRPFAATIVIDVTAPGGQYRQTSAAATCS